LGVQDHTAFSDRPAVRAIDKIDRTQQGTDSALLRFPALSPVSGMKNAPQMTDHPALVFIEKEHSVQIQRRKAGQFLLSCGWGWGEQQSLAPAEEEKE
jgi:hypothetical protein